MYYNDRHLLHTVSISEPPLISIPPTLSFLPSAAYASGPTFDIRGAPTDGPAHEATASLVSPVYGKVAERLAEAANSNHSRLIYLSRRDFIEYILYSPYTIKFVKRPRQKPGDNHEFLL